jgi:hypothetical protein
MRQLQQVPTDPSRRAVASQPQSSRLPIVIALLVALVLGAGGGMFVYARMSQPQGIGGLSLKTDRPVTVTMMGQALGQTPLVSWVPSGQHELQLTESDGTVRVVQITVVTGQVTEKSLALDEVARKP